jgi:hypothetical protein
MAIATLAAVNQFVFSYLHNRLKLPQTSTVQRSFPELFTVTSQLSSIIRWPAGKLAAFESWVSLP